MTTLQAPSSITDALAGAASSRMQRQQSLAVGPSNSLGVPAPRGRGESPAVLSISNHGYIANPLSVMLPCTLSVISSIGSAGCPAAGAHLHARSQQPGLANRCCSSISLPASRDPDSQYGQRCPNHRCSMERGPQEGGVCSNQTRIPQHRCGQGGIRCWCVWCRDPLDHAQCRRGYRHLLTAISAYQISSSNRRHPLVVCR